MPSAQAPGVGASPYPAVQALSGDFRLVDPAQLRGRAGRVTASARRGRSRRPLPGGKAFWMGVFEGPQPPT